MSQSASTAGREQSAAGRAPDAARSGTATTDAARAAAADGRAPLSTTGMLAAVGSYVIWGVLPLYLKPLHAVSALQIIAHRGAWACVLFLLWLFLRGELKELRKPLTNPTILGRLTVSALLITVNWLAYVWGVGHGRVVEASLGYFINPLANVLLGGVVLRERLNIAQWTAVGIAAGAVLYIAVATGATPWISLTLAASFSIYGLLRKLEQNKTKHNQTNKTHEQKPVALG